MNKHLLFLIFIITGSAPVFSQAKLETVSKVDLNRYSGTWYEICHLPARFLDGCDCISATYTQTRNGNVNVYNKCRKSNGKWSSIKGKAFSVKGSGNSKLKVQFFWPFRANYYILELDDEYSYAVVGEPRRKYFWILSRTPSMDPGLYLELVRKYGNKGFAVEYLVVTSHVWCEE